METPTSYEPDHREPNTAIARIVNARQDPIPRRHETPLVKTTLISLKSVPEATAILPRLPYTPSDRCSLYNCS